MGLTTTQREVSVAKSDQPSNKPVETKKNPELTDDELNKVAGGGGISSAGGGGGTGKIVFEEITLPKGGGAL
jgi:hypothetical protein